MVGVDESILRIMNIISEINLSRFIDRMYHQKLGYLIQKMAKENVYDFSWYLRGPYSSELASSLFLHEERGTFKKLRKLSVSEIKTKEKIYELLGNNINEPFSLELYASLWYLMSGNKISSNEKEEILQIMRKEKPHFSNNEIKTALEKIITFRKKHEI